MQAERVDKSPNFEVAEVWSFHPHTYMERMESTATAVTSHALKLSPFSTRDLSSEASSSLSSSPGPLNQQQSKKRKSRLDESHEWSELTGKRMKSAKRDRVPESVLTLWREKPRRPLMWPRLVDWNPGIWEELSNLPSRPDTLLHTGSFTFAAHSTIITRQSPFFAACLQPSHFRESSTHIIDLSADPPLAIQALLRYLYTRNKRTIYRPQQPLFSDVERDVDVMIVADKYGCGELRDWMAERLVAFYGGGKTPVPPPAAVAAGAVGKGVDVDLGKEKEARMEKPLAAKAKTKFYKPIKKPTPRPIKREWDARNRSGFASILRKIWDIDLADRDEEDTDSESPTGSNPIALIPGIQTLKTAITAFITSTSSSHHAVLSWPGVRTAIIDSGELSLDLITTLTSHARQGQAREAGLEGELQELQVELEGVMEELEDVQVDLEYVEGRVAGMEREYDATWEDWVGWGGEEYYF